jgi:hypothetical protein
MLVVVLLWGCSGTPDLKKEIDYQTTDFTKEDFGLKNTDYANLCEKEYQNFKIVRDGMYECSNNNIHINMNKYNIGLRQIYLSFAEGTSKKDVLAEINKIYKSNNLKEMNDNQYEQLVKDGKKRIFNNMTISYDYNAENKMYVIGIVGNKLPDNFNNGREIK